MRRAHLGRSRPRRSELQFKLLQRMCRESRELLGAFATAGVGDLTEADARRPDAKVGAVVRAFTRFVEPRWEGESDALDAAAPRRVQSSP